MTSDDIVRIQNEIFTSIVMEEFIKQSKAGKKRDEYVLDKYAIDAQVKERLKRYLAGEASAIKNDVK